jgi:hypothetical protein
VSRRIVEVDARAGELLLACTFLDPLPERLDRLREAAQVTASWATVPLLLESHGVLVLARRNLALAGVEPPETIGATLAAREVVLREIDLRFRLSLERFVRQSAADGVEVTLLKGASLALDLYPESALRSQGDLDLLVRPRDVRRALGAGARCGFFVAEAALPLWWYRLAHFHVKLAPESPLLREIELHWALHHPSQLSSLPCGSSGCCCGASPSTSRACGRGRSTHSIAFCIWSRTWRDTWRSARCARVERRSEPPAPFTATRSGSGGSWTSVQKWSGSTPRRIPPPWGSVRASGMPTRS